MKRVMKLRAARVATFVAHAAVAFEQEEPRVLVAVAAADPWGDGASVTASRCLAPTESDRESCLDTYCIAVDGGASAYGGVDAVSWTDTDVTFELGEVTARALGLPPKLRIRLAIPPADRAAYLEGLRQILAGVPGA
jgi:hypothetical protein